MQWTIIWITTIILYVIGSRKPSTFLMLITTLFVWDLNWTRKGPYCYCSFKDKTCQNVCKYKTEAIKITTWNTIINRQGCVLKNSLHYYKILWVTAAVVKTTSIFFLENIICNLLHDLHLKYELKCINLKANHFLVYLFLFFTLETEAISEWQWIYLKTKHLMIL